MAYMAALWAEPHLSQANAAMVYDDGLRVYEQRKQHQFAGLEAKQETGGQEAGELI